MFETLDERARGLLDRWAGRPDGAAGSWMGMRHLGINPLPPSERAERPLGWGFFAHGGEIGDQDLTSSVDEGGGDIPSEDAGMIGGMIIPPNAPWHMHFPSYWEGMSHAEMAAELAKYGRFGDTELVHVSPYEKEILKRYGGSGTVNPHTGLREYWDPAGGGSNTQGSAGGGGGNQSDPSQSYDVASGTWGASGGTSNIGPGGSLSSGTGGKGGSNTPSGGALSQAQQKQTQVASLRESQAPAGYYSPAEAANLGLGDRSVAPQYGTGRSGVYQDPNTGKYYASPSLIGAIQKQETGIYKNPYNVISPTGALGRMQLMPDTAAEQMNKLMSYTDADGNFHPGVNPNTGKAWMGSDFTGGPSDPRTDPNMSDWMGRDYLNQQVNTYGGDANAAAGAYNAGPTRYSAYLAGTKTLPAETANYQTQVAKYLAANQAANPTGLAWNSPSTPTWNGQPAATPPTHTVLGQPAPSDPPATRYTTQPMAPSFSYNDQRQPSDPLATGTSPLTHLATQGTTPPSSHTPPEYQASSYYNTPFYGVPGYGATPPDPGSDPPATRYTTQPAPPAGAVYHDYTDWTDPTTVSYRLSERPSPPAAPPGYDVLSGYHPGNLPTSAPSYDVLSGYHPENLPAPSYSDQRVPSDPLTSGYRPPVDPMAGIRAPGAVAGPPTAAPPQAGNATVADYQQAQRLGLTPDQYEGAVRNLRDSYGDYRNFGNSFTDNVGNAIASLFGFNEEDPTKYSYRQLAGMAGPGTGALTPSNEARADWSWDPMNMPAVGAALGLAFPPAGMAYNLLGGAVTGHPLQALSSLVPYGGLATGLGSWLAGYKSLDDALGTSYPSLTKFNMGPDVFGGQTPQYSGALAGTAAGAGAAGGAGGGSPASGGYSPWRGGGGGTSSGPLGDLIAGRQPNTRPITIPTPSVPTPPTPPAAPPPPPVDPTIAGGPLSYMPYSGDYSTYGQTGGEHTFFA